MATLPIDRSVTPLRQRMLDDMAMRSMRARTQHDYVRHVRLLAGGGSWGADATSANLPKALAGSKQLCAKCKPSVDVEGSVMAVAVKLYRQARAVERYPTKLESTVRRGDDPLDATVLDLSTHGFSIEPEEPLTVGDEISVGLSGIGKRAARVVWREADRFGCEFKVPLEHREVAGAFSAETVVPGSFVLSTQHQATSRQVNLTPAPTIERWPLRSRIAIILGASAALWAAIIVVAHALVT